MKTILLALCLIFTTTAHANGPWNKLAQDQIFPTQEILEHDQLTNPLLGSGITILGAGVMNNGTATTVSTFASQPDFPRNIVLTPTGTTANVGAGTAVVNGTNIFGKSISENFAISGSQSSATTGLKAFKSVTSIVFPATTGAGVTLNVVAGVKLGLRRCAANAGDLVFSELNGVFETSRGTLVPNATAIESNTFAPNGAMNGSKNVDIFYIQNFRCYGN